LQPASIVVVAGAVFLYALCARPLGRTILTAPILFSAVGLALGPTGFGLVELGLEAPLVHLVVEGALVLLLFTDASRIRFAELRRGFTLPTRLLMIGLPLTIAIGAAVGGILLPELSWAGLALLAIMVAPTDAALGQAVVTNGAVPARVRQALNVESGLNDGIAVPLFVGVLLVAGVASHASGGDAGHDDVTAFAAKQLLLGPLAGLAVAWPAGWLVERSVVRRTSTTTTVQIAGLVIAVAAFFVAGLIGGNGLIAAFVAGLVIGNTTPSACESLREFAEDQGQLLTLLAFLTFGTVMLPHALEGMTPRTVLYTVASLTVVRMLPVFLSLLGTGLRAPTVLFLGWFGPRGLASVLFALMVYEEHGFADREQVFCAASLIVAASILLHGVTAAPLAARYGRWHERLRAGRPEAPECNPAPALPMRFTCPQEDAGS
jgi:NhaP-type Na+/H+ or K+/H+ antiporter